MPYPAEKTEFSSYGILRTGKEIRSFKGHQYRINAVVFSHDGKSALSASYDKSIKLWDINTGKEIRTFNGHQESVNTVAFSPDGKSILSGSSDKTIKLWNISDGKEIRSFNENLKAVTSVAFRPDGKFIVSASRNIIGVWEAETGKYFRSYAGHLHQINSLVVSPDGKRILSGSDDSTIRLWNIFTSKEIYQIAVFPDNEWVTLLPEGFYNCSYDRGKRLNIRINNQVLGMDQFYKVFYRPDLVSAKLREDYTPVNQAAAKSDIQKVLAGGAPGCCICISKAHAS